MSERVHLFINDQSEAAVKVQLYQDGAKVGSLISAVNIEREAYYFDVPTPGTATGYYVYGAFTDDGGVAGNLLSQGEFYYDSNTIGIKTLEYMANELLDRVLTTSEMSALLLFYNLELRTDPPGLTDDQQTALDAIESAVTRPNIE